MKKAQRAILAITLGVLTTATNLIQYTHACGVDVPSLELPTPISEVPKESVSPMPIVDEEALKKAFTDVLTKMLETRNDCIARGDFEKLKSLYNLKCKLSLWAYESESTKLKYLKNWSEKQSVIFTDIHSTLKIRKVREREPGLFGVTCNISTEFIYHYADTPTVENRFKLGTSHYLHLRKDDDHYIIVKEWYTDPFADSLDLNNLKSEEIKHYILNHTASEYAPDKRTQKAIDYAHRYCGVSDESDYLFKYNKAYTNFNPQGGDCANFASQILHEGGNFKKNGTWGYVGGDGSKAWVNAQAFKNYMVNSGRGSYIARGTYNEVYKAAYQLRPGDFVAYEKKGKIVHISTVTGLDSKGYPLVTCHNTDRLLVPYDLGWSNKGIKFHLIDVHY